MGLALSVRATVWRWLPLEITTLAGFRAVISHLTREPSSVTGVQALVTSVPSTVTVQFSRLLPSVKRTATNWLQPRSTSLVWLATTRSCWVVPPPPPEELPPPEPPLEEGTVSVLPGETVLSPALIPVTPSAADTLVPWVETVTWLALAWTEETLPLPVIRVFSAATVMASTAAPFSTVMWADSDTSTRSTLPSMERSD